MVNINHCKCTGCHLCQLICSYTKTGKFDLNKARISIIERDEEGFTQMICRNCHEAPCMDACPAGTIVRRQKDGFIVLNDQKCVGCNMCIMVCPFNAIDSLNHKNYKCDTCEGLEKCALICDQDAIEFSDINKEIKRKRRKNMEIMIKD